MSTLVDRLREAIDDDERLALGVPGGDWREATEDGNWNEFNKETLAHIVRHDPARVLRDVAAKREILELHSPERRTWADVGPNLDRFEREAIECCECGGDSPCQTVLVLAKGYGIEVADL